MRVGTRISDASIRPFVPSIKAPWGSRMVRLLYRKVAFGADPGQLQAALAQSPEVVVDALVDEAIAVKVREPPYWAHWTKAQFDDDPDGPFQFRKKLKLSMIEDLFSDNLRGRLTLFWSNHFVTQDNVYNVPPYMVEYYRLLQEHAIGNFKTMTRAMGTCSAMLVFLNGNTSTNKRPNENYARELYELFTLGVNNGYTQEDIVETARALTGWTKRNDQYGPYVFDPTKFDNTPKTIFGQTANYDHDGLVDLLFEQRSSQIATYICTKLYRYFVRPVPDTAVIQGMAQTMLDNNFEIAAVLRELFKSAHFYEEEHEGVLVKSPYDMIVSFFRESALIHDADFDFHNALLNGANSLEQRLFRPIDVAGWQGDTDWISSALLVTRWQLMEWYLWRARVHDLEQFRTLAKRIMGGQANDVVLIAKTIIHFFVPKELVNPIEYDQAIGLFKGDVPENYYEDGTWNLDWDRVPIQVYDLVRHCLRMPEFQLK